MTIIDPLNWKWNDSLRVSERRERSERSERSEFCNGASKPSIAGHPQRSEGQAV